MQELCSPQSQAPQSARILYTPSSFARDSLLYLQEAGALTAGRSRTSRRGQLPSYLCFIVTDGTGKLSYGGEQYELAAGDIVFIDCQQAYSYSTGSTGDMEDEAALWSLQWCHFYGLSMPAIYGKYCERGGRPVIHGADPEPYVTLLSEIRSLAASFGNLQEMQINGHLSTLLALLMKSSWYQGSNAPNPKQMDLGKVKDFLDKYYGERMSLDTVASHFFIDKCYLARIFKEQYGMTLTAYLHQVRITHAKYMLRFTKKRIDEIGMECGIDEPNYFSRVFRKLEGMSPSEYRELW